MSKPSAYDLLTVIHQEVKDLRAELLSGHEDNEKRIGDLEKFQYNLMGKIGVGVLVVGTIVSSTITLIISWFKDRV